MADEEEAAPESDNGEAPPAVEDAPTADEAFALKGHRLDEMGGAQVGRVEGQVVTKGTQRVEWLVARMGRFGHYCLVPGRDAVVANGRVWVPYSRDQIRRAPRFEPSKEIDPEAEQTMLAHYGLT